MPEDDSKSDICRRSSKSVFSRVPIYTDSVLARATSSLLRLSLGSIRNPEGRLDIVRTPQF
jgi:hypothetical protein